VIWTFFEGETAQCHLEISIVFYFEMFQLNHTYRNGLVSSERQILIAFPTDWHNTCLWHWPAQTVSSGLGQKNTVLGNVTSFLSSLHMNIKECSRLMSPFVRM